MENHYYCDECGELIEGASYDHRPTCSAFPVAQELTDGERQEITAYVRESEEWE